RPRAKAARSCGTSCRSPPWPRPRRPEEERALGCGERTAALLRNLGAALAPRSRVGRTAPPRRCRSRPAARAFLHPTPERPEGRPPSLLRVRLADDLPHRRSHRRSGERPRPRPLALELRVAAAAGPAAAQRGTAGRDSRRVPPQPRASLVRPAEAGTVRRRARGAVELEQSASFSLTICF